MTSPGFIIGLILVGGSILPMISRNQFWLNFVFGTNGLFPLGTALIGLLLIGKNFLPNKFSNYLKPKYIGIAVAFIILVFLLL